MKKQRKYLKDLIAININKLVLYDGSFEYQFDGNTLSLVPGKYGKRCFLAVFINGIRQQMSWDLYERPHRGTLKNSQIPYNRDTVFYVVSGGRRFRHLFIDPVPRIQGRGSPARPRVEKMRERAARKRTTPFRVWPDNY